MVYTTPPSIIFKNGGTTNVTVNTSANTLTLTGNAVLSGLTDPSSNTDAVTRNYTDVKTWKTSVRAATTGSIFINSPATTSIDGLTIVDGDRVLVKNKGSPSQNGIYVYRSASTDYARTDDAQSGYNASGVGIFANEGTTNGGTFWVCTTASASFNSNPISFVKFVGIQGTLGELWYNDGGSFNTTPDFTYDTGTPTITIAEDTNGSSLNISTLTSQSGAISIGTGSSSTSVLSIGGSTLNLGTTKASTVINMATDTSHSGNVGLLNNASSTSDLSLGSSSITVNVKGVEGPTGIVVEKTTTQSVSDGGFHDTTNYDTVTWTNGSSAPTINLTTGVITINEDGVYMVTFNVPITNTGGGNTQRQTSSQILINGSTAQLLTQNYVNNTSAGSADVTTNSAGYFVFSNADTLKLQLNQNYGNARNFCSTTKPLSISVMRVNGS